MSFSFEVKESDLLGRIGTIKVGGKSLETPYLFPVIHPVSQSVPTSVLRTMGYGGLMTNSYIIHSRRREEALSQGIHSLLDFAGVLMTDSGGYQVLEYGDLELSYSEVADFQDKIGSDMAVTLDRPTGYPQARSTARETVEYSLRNAEATLREFEDSKTIWVGPIQGGIYQDLVKKSAQSLVTAGFGFLALGSPVQVMENYMFADLVRMIISARKAIPYATPLHLFGAGHPLTMPLAVALGCDTFDSASYIIFARNGRYMSRSGVMTLQTMKYLPCSCQACAKSSVKELLELPFAERTKQLAIHNLLMLKEELGACKEAMVEGRLWDFVEERSMAHPRLREAFVELSKHTNELVIGTPALKERGLFVRSKEDLSRPELDIASKMLSNAHKRSSARATLDLAGMEGRSRKKTKDIQPDRYKLHPALGPYPSELEFQYPFSQTETTFVQSVEGIKEAKKRLKILGYRSVIVRRRPAKNRRSRRGASPSPRSSSARPR